MTPVFAAYVAPARPRAELWRTVLGLGVIMAVYLGLIAAAGFVARMLGGGGAWLERLAEGADPWSMLALLFTFLAGWVAVWVAVRGLHRRGWRSLFGHPPRVLADFALGLGAMLVVGGGLAALALPWLPPLEPALDPRLWLMILPLAIVGLLVQTGAEELVFRGYLQQQLAARFASPLVWMVVPSVLFGLAHHAPEANGTSTWLVVAVTGLFGLIAADLTARSGSLGLAWGLHFANNLLAILVISAMPQLDGLALFRLGDRSADILVPLLVLDMVLLTAVWAFCRFRLSRR
jgi:membrane protease YdiL (CAAX protease family)